MAKQILDDPLSSNVTELKTKLAAWNEFLHSEIILRKEQSMKEQEGYKAMKELQVWRYVFSIFSAVSVLFLLPQDRCLEVSA